MNILLRKSKKTEGYALAHAQQEAFKGDSKKLKYHSSLEHESIKDIKDRIYQSDTQISLTIFLNEEIVGGVRVLVFPDKTYYIERLFIHPEHQRKGIGRKVMTILEEHYPDAIAWSLRTEKKKRANKKFYKSLGYKVVSTCTSRDNCVFLDFKKICK